MNIRRIIFIPLERRRGDSTSGGVKSFKAAVSYIIHLPKNILFAPKYSNKCTYFFKNTQKRKVTQDLPFSFWFSYLKKRLSRPFTFFGFNKILS
jgi:hypothetical protein